MMNNDKSNWEEKQIKEKPMTDNDRDSVQFNIKHCNRLQLDLKKWIITAAAVISILAGMILFGYHSTAQIPGQQSLPQNPSSSPDALKQVESTPLHVKNEESPASHVVVVERRHAASHRAKGAELGGKTTAAAKKQTITFPSTNGGEVQLPLQMTKAEFSLDDGTRTITTKMPKPPVMSYKIPPEMKDRLQAMLVYRSDMAGGYILLAPSGWEASAMIGANGSYGVTLSDPGNPKQTLHYSDTAGSCQGCAINSIGTYFLDRTEWADQQGFTVYDPLSFVEWKQLGTSEEDARTAAYKTKAEEGYYNKGVVYYHKDTEGYLFRKLEFTLSDENTIRNDQLVIVLDFFRVHYGPLIVAE